MQERNLPESYMGYLTSELLTMLEQIGSPSGLPKDTPEEKILAMNRFDREFKITPVAKLKSKRPLTAAR